MLAAGKGTPMKDIARAALLAGLLAVAAPAAAQPGQGSAGGFTIVDERPPKEKKNRLWSVWIFDCNFGVYNIGDAGIGDERLAQDRLGDLRRHLEASLGSRLDGRSLRIGTYRIIVNGNARAKAFSFSGSLGGGAVGEAAAGAIADGKTDKAKCSREKMAAGWFDMSEITNSNSPMIVEIAGSLDGRPVSGRAVRSPSRELYKDVALVRIRAPDLEEFRQTIAAASDALAASIARILPPP